MKWREERFGPEPAAGAEDRRMWLCWAQEGEMRGSPYYFHQRPSKPVREFLLADAALGFTKREDAA